MTSQTETLEELKLKAKALKIKGAHLYKDAESLQAKIDEVTGVDVVVAAVTEAPKRKKAPKMSVGGILSDDRAELVARLEAEDPDAKYIFQRGDISDRELAGKGLERTEHVLRNDVLCRTDREAYNEVQANKRKAQYDSMQRIDGGQGIIDNFTEVAKKPRGS
jgi:hypothetical protein